MSTVAGVKIWDKDGKLAVGPTTAVGSILGVVTTGGVNGSITDARFSQGTPRIFAALPVNESSGDGYYSPIFSFSGNVLSWTYRTGSFYKPNIRIIYGVS